MLLCSREPPTVFIIISKVRATDVRYLPGIPETLVIAYLLLRFYFIIISCLPDCEMVLLTVSFIITTSPARQDKIRRYLTGKNVVYGSWH